jgi:predicted amidophosphoribosyltransferase
VGGSVLAALADLVLPRTCAGCAVPGSVLCRRCAALLARPRLATPRRVPWGFPPTVAAGAYRGPLRPVVIAFKEQGRAELAGPLGVALALAVAAVSRGVPERRGPLLLVPVPSSRVALRTRGRDHVRELTRQAVAELRAAGLPAAEARLLCRRGRVLDSATLSAPQRRANLSGTFLLDPGRPRPGPGALLVLVDDVVTSGATLTEAAAVLAEGALPGALPVVAAVVAATPRMPGTDTPARDLRVVPDGAGPAGGASVDRLSGAGSRD